MSNLFYESSVKNCAIHTHTKKNSKLYLKNPISKITHNWKNGRVIKTNNLPPTLSSGLVLGWAWIADAIDDFFSKGEGSKIKHTKTGIFAISHFRYTIPRDKNRCSVIYKFMCVYIE